jgi:16S rRNA (cytosine967-C5)-methyltransferase
MKPASIYGHAVELLDAVTAGSRPADVVVAEFYRARKYLGARDRREIGEAVYGVLRQYRLLSLISERLRGADELSEGRHGALLAIYLLRFGHRADEAVREDLAPLWREGAGGVSLEEFILRYHAFDLDKAVAPDHAERLALIHSLPVAVVRDWIESFAEDEAANLAASSNAPPPVGVRVNTLRCTVAECAVEFTKHGIQAERAQYSPEALVLSKRASLERLPSFERGWFELQDEGSQLIARIVDPKPGQIVVDACAGSGGKSLALAALMRNSGKIHALDVDAARLGNIRDRIRRSGASIIVPGISTSSIGSADLVLVDAPCSGTGTYRRNPAAKLRFSEPALDRLVLLQEELLDRNARFVRSGGKLIYATCSTLSVENDRQIEKFLQRHPDYTLRDVRGILSDQGIAVALDGRFLRLHPHKHGTDGYFAAVMVRKSD